MHAHHCASFLAAMTGYNVFLFCISIACSVSTPHILWACLECDRSTFDSLCSACFGIQWRSKGTADALCQQFFHLHIKNTTSQSITALMISGWSPIAEKQVREWNRIKIMQNVAHDVTQSCQNIAQLKCHITELKYKLCAAPNTLKFSQLAMKIQVWKFNVTVSLWCNWMH